MINVAVIGLGFMGITHALNIQRNRKLNLRAIITRILKIFHRSLMNRSEISRAGRLKGEFIRVCTTEEVNQIPAGDANQGFYDEIDYFASCIENDGTNSMFTFIIASNHPVVLRSYLKQT